MLLIATDEAGYGPKLGPLVIVATAWRLPDALAASPSQTELDDLFARLREPVPLGDLRVVVDDSKAVYQSKAKHNLRTLHATVSAAMNWVGTDQQGNGSESIVQQIAGDDYQAVMGTPWLRHDSAEKVLTREATDPVIHQWSKSGIRMQAIAAKIITASGFNEACESGRNKADLLSESTLSLVRRTIESCAIDQDSFEIFCDRHGGRRYYGGVLQHTFGGSNVAMIAESKLQSTYQFDHRGNPVTIRFTVKGDSFAPVALSSIIAKYLRERMMNSLNRYFSDRHLGDTPLKPTAGYPVDADRFLTDVAPIIKKHRINRRDLIRQR